MNEKPNISIKEKNYRLENEVAELRELLALAYIELSGTSVHSSDCDTSCAPAYTPKKCNCNPISTK